MDPSTQTPDSEPPFERAKVLQEAGRLAEAEAAYREAVAADPSDVRAHNNLGTVLEALARPEEAIQSYRDALAVDPNAAPVHFNVGHLYQRYGQLEGAVQAYRFAIALQRPHPAAYFNLVQALLDLGRGQEAAAAAEEWLAADPDSARARHLCAALGAGEAPARAADGYVVEVFDRMAADFDEALSALDYRAPQLVADALTAHGPAGSAGLDVLDAGCGTGLAGPLFRRLARRLVGVDLSERMLERARERGAYDELVRGELTAYLEAHPAAFDVVAAVDTLVYFGDLAPALAAAHRALRPGGRLVFTLEELTDPGPGAGHRLSVTGRYAHHPDYVETVLADAGFTRVSLDRAVLRREGAEAVSGLVVVATR